MTSLSIGQYYYQPAADQPLTVVNTEVNAAAQALEDVALRKSTPFSDYDDHFLLPYVYNQLNL